MPESDSDDFESADEDVDHQKSSKGELYFIDY